MRGFCNSELNVNFTVLFFNLCIGLVYCNKFTNSINVALVVCCTSATFVCNK